MEHRVYDVRRTCLDLATPRRECMYSTSYEEADIFLLNMIPLGNCIQGRCRRTYASDSQRIDAGEESSSEQARRNIRGGQEEVI